MRVLVKVLMSALMIVSTVKTLVLSLFAISVSATAGPSITHRPARQGLFNLPLGFEANRGQTDSRVKFLARAPGIGLFLTPREAVLHLEADPDKPAFVLRMRLPGSNQAPRMEGLAALPGKSNYFHGPKPSNWRTDVPTFSKVAYRSVYPGVDLVFHGARSGHLEYDFVVAPGSDPAPISVAFEGADSVRLDANGGAVVKVGETELRQPRPHIYQTIAGREVPVEGRFVLKGRNRLGFSLARYDTRYPLVIDPVMIYASIIGGPGYDEGWGIAVDSQGNAYITGRVYGSGFPVVRGVSSSGEAFITKINAAGTSIVYSTYISGPIGYGGTAIAVDAQGSAYITGQAGDGLPTTVNAAQPALGGYYDAYVVKLNPAGNALAYSTYLGGNGPDRGFGIAVDAAGNAYVTGEASSTNFPLVNAVQTQMMSVDAFLTKVSSSGSSFVYSTLIGGEGYDLGTAVAVDASGSAVVAGYTNSLAFPVVNALQPTSGGYYDIFVTRLTPAGNAVVFSTYVGGSWWDSPGNSISFDSAGNIWIAGTSSSPNFPLAGAFQTSNNGADDVVLFSLNPSGSTLPYSTYVGGASYDNGYGVAVLPYGHIAVVGRSSSSNFPTVNPLQSTVAGYTDALVFVLNPTSNSLAFSTLWGGPYQDWALNVAVDAAGSIYFTGVAESSLFPVVNPILPSTEGFNPFVAKIGTSNLAVTSLTSNLPLPGSNSPLVLTATVANNGAFDLPAVGLRIFLDTNSNAALDSGEASSQTTVTNLAAGASRAVSMSFAAPPGGSYQAVAVVDPDNLIVEAIDSDNTAVIPIVIPRPDYAVTGFSSVVTPAGPPGRFDVSLNATIANLGPAGAPNVQIQFSVSSDGGATYSDIGGLISAGSIAPGSFVVVTATLRNALPGAYLIKVTADPNDLILENNEANNTATFPLTIT